MDYVKGELLYFDKPLYWTSFKLVGRVRWALCKYLGVKKLKVGHTGTLDPLATGVMVICTGKATKLVEQLQADEKEYEAQLYIGATTPSFDLEHEIDAYYPTEHINEEAVRSALKKFEGDIMQEPPHFSAVKIDGKRAYDYAREGESVKIEAKPISIKKIELLSYNLPYISIKVICSKGTYIRSLARDIGRELGSGAHLTALKRTRIGNITLQQCQSFADFKKSLGQNEDAED